MRYIDRYTHRYFLNKMTGMVHKQSVISPMVADMLVMNCQSYASFTKRSTNLEEITREQLEQTDAHNLCSNCFPRIRHHMRFMEESR